MSGLIPDLASWALRGQSNENNEGEEEGNAAGGGEGETLTAEEMRAQRLQRMEQQQAAATASAASLGPEPMEVEKTPVPEPAAKPKAKKAPPPVSVPPDPVEKKKKRKAEKDNDPARRLHRKKETLLRKVLGIVVKNSTLAGSSSMGGESSFMTVDLGDEPSISVQSIAEILSTRVAGSPPPTPTTPSSAFGSSFGSNSNNKSLLAYLAASHRKAADELKTIRTTSANTRKESAQVQAQNAEMTELLQEIQKQVVSYAATVLMEPDLFEQGKNSAMQLAYCLYTSLSDISGSITFGVGNNVSNSFYYLLVEELLSQDEASLERVVKEIVQVYRTALQKCESVLENNVVLPANLAAAGGGQSGDANPMALVSALTALTMHKKVAEIVTQTRGFLLPPVDSPKAAETVRPPPPASPTIPPAGTGNSNQRLFQLMANLAQQQQPQYKKRSGPALEKDTLLGLCLSVGIPTKNNTAFAPQTIMRQSLASVESSTNQQRQQLKHYQEAYNQFIRNLVKAGETARGNVMEWFTDALLVNVGASATRPDPSKVSSAALLLNLSAALLKLCEPFVSNPKKHSLIDTHFCSAPEAHKGVYTASGDDAVQRLGEEADSAMATVDYNPKNPFVSQLFFLTARSLHFGIASSLSQHESLLRHLSHLHWSITSRSGGSANSDLQNDPQFAMLVSRQRSAEVALFQEDMVADHLHFLDLMAKVLVEMDDTEDLRHMPEDFVSDICHVITSIAKVKPKLLRDLNAMYTFKLVVKLLSPKYASMVRNYNLRAMLGDVLYELFLPPDDSRDRRESVPQSVYTDSRVGETYMLSDSGAQETLAPSLLLLYGEVEHTGYYDRMSHRAKISSMIKYLWESKQHRLAFRRITQNKESFIKFANGIMNETNTLIATVMQKLPEIREAQLKMKNTQEWGALSEEQQKEIAERLEEHEREVKHALPLCNKTLQMFGYLNTDEDIRKLFLLEELCSRLVAMLLHVMTKLVGSKGLELKVENPEELEFKPKMMLRDLCYIFGLFAKAKEFQVECAKSGGDPNLLRQALKPIKKLNLLQGEQLEAFESFPALMEEAAKRVAADEALLGDAPDEFLCEILSTFMKDPVKLPSGHFVDRSTIAQHLLNDSMDPFNRQPITMDDVETATELKAKIDAWLEEKKASQMSDD